MTKIKSFFKNVENGLLGVISEIALVYFFILAAFFACIIWRLIFR